MRVFVTGASGFIGSAVIPELIDAGHEVLALARSDASALALTATGAEVLSGDLEDLNVLERGAAASDGVIHLAFIHDFSRHEEAVTIDKRAIETLAAPLEGSNRPLVVASGVVGLGAGRLATERDDWESAVSPRFENARMTLTLASRGVRSSIVRLAPTVHGEGDHGFIPWLINIARETGVSGYVGDGSNHWPAVHRLDAATLFRLALESAPAGSVLHGVADEGVPVRTIAEIIGRHLNLPVRSVPAEEADEHFGWLARVLALDSRASSALTRELLGWNPTHAGLIEDLEQGHYYRVPAAK